MCIYFRLMDELLSHSIFNLDSGYNFLKDSLQKNNSDKGPKMDYSNLLVLISPNPSTIFPFNSTENGR